MALSSLLSSVLDAVSPEAHRAGVTINRACNDGTLLVEGDAAQLRDVFLNLRRMQSRRCKKRPADHRLRADSKPPRRVRVEDRGSASRGEPGQDFRPVLHDRERGTGIGLVAVYRDGQIHNA